MVHQAVLLMLQALAATPPERIDLMPPAAPRGCVPDNDDDIVVCEERIERHRLPPPRPAAPVRNAETRLFGDAVGAVETEAAGMPNGNRSNRLMARIKLPL